MNNNLKSLTQKIKLIVFDVDGVLTDGNITISSDGTESKNFCVEDGTGAAIASFAKLPLIFLSGRYSKCTEIRADELKINDCFQGYLDKKNKLIEIIKKYKTKPNNIAYIGDGLVDLPVFDKVGLSIAVPNAHPLVIKKADYLTNKKGGEGVLTEVVEFILKSQDRYNDALNKMKREIFK